MIHFLYILHTWIQGKVSTINVNYINVIDKSSYLLIKKKDLNKQKTQVIYNLFSSSLEL